MGTAVCHPQRRHAVDGCSVFAADQASDSRLLSQGGRAPGGSCVLGSRADHTDGPQCLDICCLLELATERVFWCTFCLVRYPKWAYSGCQGELYRAILEGAGLNEGKLALNRMAHVGRLWHKMLAPPAGACRPAFTKCVRLGEPDLLAVCLQWPRLDGRGGGG